MKNLWPLGIIGLFILLACSSCSQTPPTFTITQDCMGTCTVTYMSSSSFMGTATIPVSAIPGLP